MFYRKNEYFVCRNTHIFQHFLIIYFVKYENIITDYIIYDYIIETNQPKKFKYPFKCRIFHFFDLSIILPRLKHFSKESSSIYLVPCLDFALHTVKTQGKHKNSRVIITSVIIIILITLENSC